MFKNIKILIHKRKIFYLFFLCVVFILNLTIFAYNLQSLDYVVKHALENNPNVLEDQARLSAAEYARKQAIGGYFAKVDTRFAYGRETTKSPNTLEDYITLNRTERGIYVTQPIFSGFSTYNLVKQRKLETKSAAFMQAYTKELIALQAVQAYLNVLRINQLRWLTKENVRTHEQIYRKVMTLYRGGGGRRGDVKLAYGRLSESRSFLHSVEAAQKNYGATFVQVTGLQPGKLELPQTPRVPNNLKDAVNIALEKNPAMLRAEEQVNSTAVSVDVAKGKMLPRVDIQASANDDNNLYGLEGKNRDMRAMVVAQYNLFNGGSDHALINQSHQYHIAAIHNRNDIERKIIEDVHQSWNSLVADRARLKELQSHVESSREVVKDYQQRFHLGRSSLLDVLNVENELYNAKIDLINEEYAIISDSYGLLQSMGVLVSYF